MGLADIFTFIIGIFLMAVVFVVMTYVASETYDQLLTTTAPTLQENLPAGSNATTIIGDSFGAVPNSYATLKWISVFLIIAIAIGILIFAYFVQYHPILIIPYIIIMIIAVFLSAGVSRAYEAAYNDPNLTATFAGFWGQSWIFFHLPVWVTIIGVAGGIVMFVSWDRYSYNRGGPY